MVDWLAVVIGGVGIAFLVLVGYGLYRLLKSASESYIRWVTHIHEDEKKRFREG